jgi:hypothetical protein
MTLRALSFRLFAVFCRLCRFLSSLPFSLNSLVRCSRLPCQSAGNANDKLWDISQGTLEKSRSISCLGAIQVYSVSTPHQVISCRSPILSTFRHPPRAGPCCHVCIAFLCLRMKQTSNCLQKPFFCSVRSLTVVSRGRAAAQPGYGGCAFNWTGRLFISCQVERRAVFSTGRPYGLDIPTPYLFRRMLNLK